MHHGARHRFHQIVVFIKDRLIAADHHRQGAVDGFWFAAAHRRVQHFNTFGPQRFADFPARQRRDRAHINHHGARLCPFDNAVFTQRHLFHMRRVWQHGDNDVALFGNRLRRRCGLCTRGNHVGNRFRVTVGHHQRITGFQQIFAHRFAHNAKTDKTYFDCHNVLSLHPGDYFLNASASFWVAERKTPRSLPTATKVAPHSR